GTFFDPRLDNAAQFPVAARAGLGNVRAYDDKITAKLAPLQFYQLSIPAPAPPDGSFDRRAADRGQALFTDAARGSTGHVRPLCVAGPATSRRWSANRGGPCTPARRSGSTPSRPIGLRTIVTGRHR